ncbi:hypothetical protein FRC02_010491 [Tulasnella sp. 418]|nr:hypothetical protein FRC02_010491 [Tulasnella sp. 418]
MDGLIILDNNGRPIIMSNFRNHPPSYPLVHVDSFNDALSKTQEAGNTKSLDPVLYVSNTMQPSLCFHVESGGLRFLCPASEDVDPVYVFTFLQTFLTILKEYLHDISLSTLKDHFDVVYQLLEEMLDDGKPMTTEPNALRDIVLPPSFFDKILNVAGVSGLPSMTPTPFSSPIPWRKQGVKYNNNEIYFDIAEEIEAIVGRNGSLLSSEIWGNIKCNCRLSGTPDLILSFTNPKVMLDPSFHSCVRLQKYQQTSALSFVPPDGNFVLMDYRVLASATPALKTVSAVSSTQLQLQLIPLILKPVIELGEKGGKTYHITSCKAIF